MYVVILQNFIKIPKNTFSTSFTQSHLHKCFPQDHQANQHIAQQFYQYTVHLCLSSQLNLLSLLL